MKAYLINTGAMKLVGRFATIKGAELAGEAAKFESKVVTSAADLAELTAAELLDLYNAHRGDKPELKSKFPSKIVGAERVMVLFEDLPILTAPEENKKPSLAARTCELYNNGLDITAISKILKREYPNRVCVEPKNVKWTVWKGKREGSIPKQNTA